MQKENEDDRFTTDVSNSNADLLNSDVLVEPNENFVDDDEQFYQVPLKRSRKNRSKNENRNEKTGKKLDTNAALQQSENTNATSIAIEQLPGVLTRDRFSELANFKDGMTISLFIPTQNETDNANGPFDSIAFRSTLNTVEQKLLQRDVDKSIIKELLKPAYELANDNSFWKDLTEGLGIFIANQFFKYIKMPVAPEHKIVLESSFYVTPLIPLITSSEYFYLLVISKHQLKLFKADAFSMQHIPIDLPTQVESGKRPGTSDVFVDDSAETLGSNAARVPKDLGAAGGKNNIGKDSLANYFERVDDVLWEKIFNKENAPLLLAGVEYEIPIYKSICDYHNVWEKGLTGSREHQETRSLYKDAREVMEPFFMQRTNKALEQYGNRSATGLASAVVEEIVPAAYYGRVAQLFVCSGEQVWGTFDSMTSELALHGEQLEDSEDLIDNAVVQTLSTGGDVFLLTKDQMPVEGCLAAIFRY